MSKKAVIAAALAAVTLAFAGFALAQGNGGGGCHINEGGNFNTKPKNGPVITEHHVQQGDCYKTVTTVTVA